MMGTKGLKAPQRHVVDKTVFAGRYGNCGIYDIKALPLLMLALRETLCDLKLMIADNGYLGEIAVQVKNVSEISNR